MKTLFFIVLLLLIDLTSFGLSYVVYLSLPSTATLFGLPSALFGMLIAALLIANKPVILDAYIKLINGKELPSYFPKGSYQLTPMLNVQVWTLVAYPVTLISGFVVLYTYIIHVYPY